MTKSKLMYFAIRETKPHCWELVIKIKDKLEIFRILKMEIDGMIYNMIYFNKQRCFCNKKINVVSCKASR